MKKLNPQMKDWVTRKGFEIAQIAVVFGGFEPAELVMRLAVAPSRGVQKINAATVGRVLEEMRGEMRFPLEHFVLEDDHA